MRLSLLCCFLVLFSWACADRNKMPKDILPKVKMTEVMWDIVRAEEFLNSFVIYRDTGVDKAAEANKWYDKVYQIHQITRKDFERSYAYYKDHDLLKDVLDSLARKSPPKEKTQDTATITRDTLNIPADTASVFRKKFLLDTLRKKSILKKIRTTP
jgi:hypothetical protein